MRVLAALLLCELFLVSYGEKVSMQQFSDTQKQIQQQTQHQDCQTQKETQHQMNLLQQQTQKQQEESNQIQKQIQQQTLQIPDGFYPPQEDPVQKQILMLQKQIKEIKEIQEKAEQKIDFMRFGISILEEEEFRMIRLLDFAHEGFRDQLSSMEKMIEDLIWSEKCQRCPYAKAREAWAYSPTLIGAPTLK